MPTRRGATRRRYRASHDEARDWMGRASPARCHDATVPTAFTITSCPLIIHNGLLRRPRARARAQSAEVRVRPRHFPIGRQAEDDTTTDVVFDMSSSRENKKATLASCDPRMRRTVEQTMRLRCRTACLRSQPHGVTSTCEPATIPNVQ